MIAGSAYTLLLLSAAIWDIRSRRIPNRLVAVLAGLGLSFSIMAAPLLPGAASGMSGLLIGLICWLPFYALGWLGAGDVKLYAAAGSWLGPLRTVEGALIAAVSGAVLALAWMVWSHGAKDAATTLAIATARPTPPAEHSRTVRTKRTLPYAVALTFGALAAAWLPRPLL